MANNCDVIMRIRGEHDDVLQAISGLQKIHRFPYEDDLDCTWEDDKTVEILSGCAWSMGSSREESLEDIDIIKLSDKLNVKIEYQTTECGFEFSEAFKVHSGKVIEDFVYDYYECLPAEMAYEEFLEWAERSGYDGATDEDDFIELQQSGDSISMNYNPLIFTF